MPTFEPSNERLIALWESGFPLDFAWIEFAVFFDSFAYAALCTYPTDDPDAQGLDNPRHSELKKWLPGTLEGRRQKLEIIKRSERIHLLGEIYAGNLWAIGYRTLPSGFDELVRVPRQLFYFDEAGEREQRPDIHWGKGELNATGTSYFDIRVMRSPIRNLETAKPDDSKNAMESVPNPVTSVQSKQSSKPGRRSDAEVIRAAIDDYAKTDSGLRGPVVKRYRAYRAYISLQGLDPDSGFSDKTFEKYEREFRRKPR